MPLKHSGYSNISLSLQQSSTSHVKQQRHRNIIWFNPPYGRTVITNNGKKLLQLLDLHFPPWNKFHKIFDRDNLNVSYSCTQNVGNITKSHNKKLINSSNHHAQICNCRKKKLVRLMRSAKLKTKFRNVQCQHLVTLIKRIQELQKEIFKKRYNLISSFKIQTQKLPPRKIRNIILP